MNKSAIVSRVAAQASLSRAAADNVVNAVFTAIGDGLAQDEAVAIAGSAHFRSSSVRRDRAAIPARGSITIAASAVPAFKAPKTLRDAVR